MPVPGGSGRVAWWKPATGVGAIVPDGIVGARNEGIPGGGKTESLSNDKEVLVVRAGVGLGADTLTPGEGVWYDAVVNKTTGRPNAVNVTGPGGEPVRQLCPGAAKAAAEAVAAGRAKATTAARLRDGRINASEEAASRARVVPWEARAEVERDAVAGAARRIARILRDNCAAIAGLVRIEGAGQRTARACFREWRAQTRQARKGVRTDSEWKGAARPSTAPTADPGTEGPEPRVNVTTAGRAKGLHVPVTRPPTPRAKGHRPTTTIKKRQKRCRLGSPRSRAARWCARFPTPAPHTRTPPRARLRRRCGTGAGSKLYRVWKTP